MEVIGADSVCHARGEALARSLSHFKVMAAKYQAARPVPGVVMQAAVRVACEKTMQVAPHAEQRAEVVAFHVRCAVIPAYFTRREFGGQPE